jgi:hypothetical protein
VLVELGNGTVETEIEGAIVWVTLGDLEREDEGLGLDVGVLLGVPVPLGVTAGL